MLSRFVRIQLVIFSIIGIIGLVMMSVNYMHVPSMAGIGRMDVKLNLPAAGGLYRFGNVTYRGLEVGKVTKVELTDTGAQATLSIDDSAKIPVDLKAEVRSISAVGEQYVDLRPNVDSGPYLHAGSVIDANDTTIPQPVGPMLDNVSKLVGSISTESMSSLLDETYKGLNGAGDDLGSVIDSASTLVGDVNGVSDQTAALIEDSVPLLDSQVRSTDAIDVWSRSLAGVTDQLVTNEPQIRSILATAPAAVNDTTQLLDSVKLTLPVMLASLGTVGQVAVTYHPALEQLLVLFPPAMMALQSYHPENNVMGLGMGDFRISGFSDPPPCTVGFLPPSARRPGWDTTTIDTPDGLYCKLPQDSPVAVRGARNFPCMSKPGKRAPTAAMCDSDENFEPLANEEPVVGPYPHDPSLEAQGVAPDSRYLPPDQQAPPMSSIVPPTPPRNTPAAYSGTGTTNGPTMASAQYDPTTGRYVTPDGHAFAQSDLVSPAANRTWQDMLAH
ncbi:MCE family protein [Aldersonia sp. NBC_00410]|uniref:MCE family protein n=1 Tax=Aldersonia sp. NBC_00410 TaxID=2975954 RepID=UPI00225C03C6|nr:MCE family protein [Aldersonia sp. NBC_00410]MCX5044282.1 MCE family protein [Aldersonia sp. NBC_00410]